MCGAAPGARPRTRKAVIVRFRIQLAAILAMVSIAGSAHARTWQVELDGTGDYTDIQPAVDAAAPGDTIRIGPGRFATFHPIIAPGWTEHTIVGVLKDALTFIGAGKDVTIVGPTQFFSPPGSNPKAFCSFGGFSSEISDMTIENVENGIYWSEGALYVDSCLFRAQDSSFLAMYLFVDTGKISDSLFEMAGGGSAIVILNSLGNVQGFDIESCTIDGAHYGIRAAYGARNVHIKDCTINIAHMGVGFDQLSTGTLSRCNIGSAGASNVLAINGSEVSIADSSIEGGRLGVDVGDGAIVTATGTVVAGSTLAALSVSSNARASMAQCHILPASGWSVYCYPFDGSPITIVMTGNYWGTTDPLAIEASIHDSRYYSPNPYTVLYAPFANGPVPTETTSWGHLKALWR